MSRKAFFVFPCKDGENEIHVKASCKRMAIREAMLACAETGVELKRDFINGYSFDKRGKPKHGNRPHRQARFTHLQQQRTREASEATDREFWRRQSLMYERT